MICKKCGFNNIDGSNRCQYCGTNISNVNTYSNPEASGNYNYQNVYPKDKNVLITLKKLGTSPMFLIAIIAFSVALVLNVINVMSGFSRILGQLYKLANVFDMGYSMRGIMYEWYGVSAVIGIILAIPTILICVGMWLVFASAHNN